MLCVSNGPDNQTDCTTNYFAGRDQSVNSKAVFFDNKSCLNTYPTSSAVTDPDSRTKATRLSRSFDDIVDHVVHNERELYTVTNHARQH